MKKLLSILLVGLFFIGSMSTNVSAQEDDVRKERILSYGMYTIVSDSDNVEINESIAHLPYEELHSKIEEKIIDKLNYEGQGTIIWDPEFVLELVPIEFPDLYDDLYDALIEQGYSPEEGVVGEVDFESNNNLDVNSRSVEPRTTYSRSYSYTYEAAGHGTMIISRSDLNWTIENSIINITYAKANHLGGWSLLFANASKLDNNTNSASGFFSYTVLESPLLYEAYLQVQIKPSLVSYGASTAKILSKGVNLTSGYYPG